jgi:hypothetical protein
MLPYRSHIGDHWSQSRARKRMEKMMDRVMSEIRSHPIRSQASQFRYPKVTYGVGSGGVPLANQL